MCTTLEGPRLHQLVWTATNRFARPSHPSVSLVSDNERIRYPADLRWTCIRCANSCRDLPRRERNILLTPKDVDRIARATKRRAEQFSVPSRDRFPYNRSMRKHEGRCIFLGGSRCSIYKARPLICRFYPFFLDRSKEGELKIGHDPACSGVGKGKVRGEKFFEGLAKLAKRELSIQ